MLTLPNTPLLRQTHYPELLFPVRERRNRARGGGGKFKAQKTRGKMSQDGKGGRCEGG
jgi:hypothetical protein